MEKGAPSDDYDTLSLLKCLPERCRYSPSSERFYDFLVVSDICHIREWRMPVTPNKQKRKVG